MKPIHTVLLAFAALPCSAGTTPLPEISIDLNQIAPQQCLKREWKLPHSAHQIVVCRVQPGSRPPKAENPADTHALIRQVVELRESVANETLAEAVYTMQQHLDTVAHRSLDANWRVFINHGILGCSLTPTPKEKTVFFTDPCNTHRYDAQGRPLAPGYPALTIPPYIMAKNQLIIGRLPDTLTTPGIPLPPVDLDADGANPVEKLVRMARWGDTQRAAQLLASGVDINARTQDGSTALLIAVQRRQQDMVAFLIRQGANVNLAYPSGLGPLEMARLVDAPQVAALLEVAGAAVVEKDSR